MRMIAASCLLVMLLSVVTFSGPPAQVGSSFADVYGAFAPLGILHRSYADFLFYGTNVAIPTGLASVCEDTGYLLALLHIDLLTQTGPQVVESLPRLARLRANLAVFCNAHEQTLLGISQLDAPDLVRLESASELGLFSDIYRLQNGLQFAFEAYLEGLSNEQDTWEFAVAFSLTTVLDQVGVGEIDSSLGDILYGSAEAALPPAFIPQDVALAITQLVELIDGQAETASFDEIRTLAQLIYDYVVDEL
ncbi:hypothetical protein ACFLSG_05205 [Candidatus Bipolaricaulota bacterium]